MVVVVLMVVVVVVVVVKKWMADVALCYYSCSLSLCSYTAV